MSAPADFAVLILAAGASTRMKQPKQLLPFRGRTLLTHTIDTAHHSNATHVVVVLGAEWAQSKRLIEQAFQTRVHIARCENWDNGMGASIKCGIQYLENNLPHVAGVVVLTIDQPFVTSAHINHLVDEHRTSLCPLVGSFYSDTIGVPAFFHHSYYSHLKAMPDAQGAKRILSEHQGVVASIPFRAAAIDLDTPEDYRTFIE